MTAPRDTPSGNASVLKESQIVRDDIYRIFEKLGISSRVELILYAFSHRER